MLLLLDRAGSRQRGCLPAGHCVDQLQRGARVRIRDPISPATVLVLVMFVYFVTTRDQQSGMRIDRFDEVINTSLHLFFEMKTLNFSPKNITGTNALYETKKESDLLCTTRLD